MKTNESSQQTFSREEMEQLLPDYLFCHLSADMSQRFEQTLPFFPDIQEELEQARRVFATLKHRDIYERHTHRAKNLSVRVQEQVAIRKQHRQSIMRTLRFSAPILVLGACAVFFLMPYRSHYEATVQPEISTETAVYELPAPQWSDELHAAVSASTHELTDAQITDITDWSLTVSAENSDTGNMLDDTLMRDVAEGLAESGGGSIYANVFGGGESVQSLQETDMQMIFTSLEKSLRKQRK
jgi:hypothetical protein